MGWGRRTLVIKRRQIFHQQAKAHGIAGDHVEIDMQAAASFRQQAQADIAGNALFQRQQLGAFRLAFGGERGRLRCFIGVSPVVEMQGMSGAGRRDRLPAIVGNAQAQQRMTQVQRLDGLAKPSDIQLAAVELRIQMGGHAAQRGSGLSANPIGGLHRGQSFHRVSILIQPTRLQEYIQMLIGMKIIII